MDVRRLLHSMRRWLPLLVAGTAIAAIVAFAASSLQPKTFESKTTLVVGQSLSGGSPDYTGLLASQQMAAMYASIAATRAQLDAVITQLALPTTPDDLAHRVDATAAPGSALVVITVQDSNPATAAAIANGLAARLVQQSSSSTRRQQDFQASLDAAIADAQTQIADAEARVKALENIATRTAPQDAELTALRTELATLRSSYVTMLGLSGTSAANALAVIDPAVPPAAPIAPRTLLNTVLGALLGLLVAGAIAALVEYRSREDDGAPSATDPVGADVPTPLAADRPSRREVRRTREARRP